MLIDGQKHRGTVKFFARLFWIERRRCCNVRARICFRRLTLLALCFGLALLSSDHHRPPLAKSLSCCPYHNIITYAITKFETFRTSSARNGGGGWGWVISPCTHIYWSSLYYYYIRKDVLIWSPVYMASEKDIKILLFKSLLPRLQVTPAADYWRAK